MLKRYFVAVNKMLLDVGSREMPVINSLESVGGVVRGVGPC